MKINSIVIALFTATTTLAVLQNGTYTFSGPQSLQCSQLALRTESITDTTALACVTAFQNTQQIVVGLGFIHWTVTGACSADCAMVCGLVTVNDSFYNPGSFNGVLADNVRTWNAVNGNVVETDGNCTRVYTSVNSTMTSTVGVIATLAATSLNGADSSATGGANVTAIVVGVVVVLIIIPFLIGAVLYAMYVRKGRAVKDVEYDKTSQSEVPMIIARPLK